MCVWFRERSLAANLCNTSVMSGRPVPVWLGESAIRRLLNLPPRHRTIRVLGSWNPQTSHALVVSDMRVVGEPDLSAPQRAPVVAEGDFWHRPSLGLRACQWRTVHDALAVLPALGWEVSTKPHTV